MAHATISTHPATNVTFPVTVTSSSGRKYTEEFSALYDHALPNPLLKILGAAFQNTNGKSNPVIDKARRELTLFCLFLSQFEHREGLTSTAALQPQLFLEYIEWIKRQPQLDRSRGGDSGKQWHSKYKTVEGLLKPFVNEGTFPYVHGYRYQPVEGLTPHAMKMLLTATKKEIDCFRDKLIFREDGSVTTKWEDYGKKGRVLNLAWFKNIPDGRVGIMLTQEQIDELEERWFERPTEGCDLERSAIAKKFGVTSGYLGSVRQKWKKAGREEGRPTPFRGDMLIDLNKEDVVATIQHYMPLWPTDGKLSGCATYRVYRFKNGPLFRTFSSRDEAERVAKEIGGVMSFGTPGIDNPMSNPADILLTALYVQSKWKLREKMIELFPDGYSGIIEEFFPTDFSAIYIHWISLTGWNKEAVKAVSLFQLKRLINKPTKHPLSSNHVIFSVEIALNKEDQREESQIHKALIGEKRKSQPENKPKLFIATCPTNEEYGLYRVLADYYALTIPLRNQMTELKLGKENCILVSANLVSSSPVSAFGVDGWGNVNAGRLKPFFQRHEVLLEPGGERVTSVNAQILRSTYFTTLQHMGIPLTTQMFLGRHESIDTTMLSYAGDGTSKAIIRANARKTLNSLAHKAFKGELMRYDQVATGSKSQKGTIQVFSHRNNDFFACKNRYNPTWDGNEKRLPRLPNGQLKEPCSEFRQCLFCAQCIITTDSLPFLIRWQKDTNRFADQASWTDFPLFFQKFLDAVDEVFRLCRAEESDLWKQALREAVNREMDSDFSAPLLWGGI